MGSTWLILDQGFTVYIRLFCVTCTYLAIYSTWIYLLWFTLLILSYFLHYLLLGVWRYVENFHIIWTWYRVLLFNIVIWVTFYLKYMWSCSGNFQNTWCQIPESKSCVSLYRWATHWVLDDHRAVLGWRTELCSAPDEYRPMFWTEKNLIARLFL